MQTQGAQGIQRTGVESGVLEKLKDTLDTESWMKKFNLSKNSLVELGLFLGIGFLTGFLFKKYGRYVFLFILFLVGLFALQQLNVLSLDINWSRARELFGIGLPEQMSANISELYWLWIREHVANVLSFSVGFLIGIKVG